MTKQRTKKARQLRKNQTDAEKILWRHLRNRYVKGLKFRRQYPCGPYYLDFYCPQKKLVIEVDGGQHYKPKGTYHDRLKEKYLKNLGLKIVRYSNRDVILNINGVLEDILNEIEKT